MCGRLPLYALQKKNVGMRSAVCLHTSHQQLIVEIFREIDFTKKLPALLLFSKGKEFVCLQEI